MDVKVLKVFRDEVLVKYQSQLLEQQSLSGGLNQLFHEERLDDLKLVFKLYSPIENGLKPVADRFKQYVIT